MRLFNSLQLTMLFAVMPFVIGWLGTGPFVYADTAVFWIAIIAYAAGFFGMCASVYTSLHWD